VQQRCLEFKALIAKPDVMVNVLPVDASCEDIEVDDTLSFLSGFVQAAHARGAAPYTPPVMHDEDDEDDSISSRNVLKITPYERALAPQPVAMAAVALAAGSAGSAIDINNFSAMLSSPAPSMAPTQGNQLLGSGLKSAGPWGKKSEPPAQSSQTTPIQGQVVSDLK
jgi:hypothetical protein